MDEINRQRLSHRPSQASVGPSVRTQPAPASSAASTTLLVPPTEEFEQGEEEEDALGRKEGWKETWREKAQRRTCFGMPLWGTVVICTSILFAGIVGGVVGGVIGNRQGQQQAWAAGAITTIWLDAVPTTVAPGTSPLPTGHYQVPFNQTQEIHQCIPEAALTNAWSCMDLAYIGLTVGHNNGEYSATFEDFSTNTADFSYGPQPPDFNGTSFPLEPMSDKDDGNLGVAMFFSVLFDKLSIIPEWALQPSASKRANTDEIFKRNADYDGAPLQPSQQPWFCFWNSTINEVFIYLNEAAPGVPATSQHIAAVESSTQWGHWSPTTTSFLPPMGSAMALQEVTAATSATPTPTVFQAYIPTPPTPTQPSYPQKRSYNSAQPNISNYPKLIKMVEKRKPFTPDQPNVLPYCQKMQVLDNMMIVPIPSVDKITIDEVQYTTSGGPPPPPAATNAVRLGRRDDIHDTIAELESYCICEWTSS